MPPKAMPEGQPEQPKPALQQVQPAPVTLTCAVLGVDYSPDDIVSHGGWQPECYKVCKLQPL